ncbi:MAG: small, acid-soluble spore protein, alpha/beta type [Lachnospiraceae bacterium]
MKKKKEKEVRLEDKLKYEIAQELGLYDKVVREGWKSLSARETGKIGGMITKKKRELKKKEENLNESIDEG